MRLFRINHEPVTLRKYGKMSGKWAEDATRYTFGNELCSQSLLESGQSFALEGGRLLNS